VSLSDASNLHCVTASAISNIASAWPSDDSSACSHSTHQMGRLRVILASAQTLAHPAETGFELRPFESITVIPVTMIATQDQQGAAKARTPRMFSSSMRRTDVSATAVMGPLVSGDRTTSRNGARYSIGRTLRQSAGDGPRDRA